MRMLRRYGPLPHLLVLFALLSGCGGGGEEQQNHQVSVSASPAGAGSVSGGGAYVANATATVQATPNAGYFFVNWSEAGQAVSDSAAYSFTVTSARDLVANFATHAYTVGGSVTGLTGTLVLRNNGSDDLTVSANGDFLFPTLVAEGNAYAVTVHTQPAGQLCTVSQGSGTVASEPVTAVTVVCADAATDSDDSDDSGDSGDSGNTGETVKSCDDYSRSPTTITQTEVFAPVYHFDYDTSVTVNSPFGRDPDDALVEGPDGNFYGVTRYGGMKETGYNGDGVVFRLSPNGDITRMHTFEYLTDGSLHGRNPVGGLTLGSDCYLYGTTTDGFNGGNLGTVFKMSLEGEVTFLVGFDQIAQGRDPMARLVEGSDGNFYGVALYGGEFNNLVHFPGTVYQVTPQGSLTALHSFDATHGGLPVGALLEGSDGYFYGVTERGGANGEGTIFKISPDGDFMLLWSFEDTTGTRPQGGLVEGPDGAFYGTTSSGGISHGGVVFKLGHDGDYSVVHYFNVLDDRALELGCNCGISKPWGPLVLASDGNFYGVSWGGGAGPGTNTVGSVFQMTPDGAVSPVLFFANGTGEPHGGLIQGSDGHLYGTTRKGGENGAGMVFRVLLPASAPSDDPDPITEPDPDPETPAPGGDPEPDPALDAMLLTSGEPETIPASTAGTTRLYRIEVPAGTSRLGVNTSSSYGGLHMFVFAGELTEEALECSATNEGTSTQNCTIYGPAPGDWYVRVDSVGAHLGATITAVALTN